MKTVGVKELKAHLSEYLRAVKRGEVVVVTERDQIIAELRAPRQEKEMVVNTRDALVALTASGEISPATARKKGWTWAPAGLGLPAGTATTLLDELSADAPLP
ncbi:MAG: type II toxin-antitoxin system prevent-host-death family antitoxin [Gemmatimonadaceae bacterium]